MNYCEHLCTLIFSRQITSYFSKSVGVAAIRPSAEKFFHVVVRHSNHLSEIGIQLSPRLSHLQYVKMCR